MEYNVLCNLAALLIVSETAVLIKVYINFYENQDNFFCFIKTL